MSTPVRDVGDLLGSNAKITISSPETPEDRSHRQRVEVLVLSFGMGLVVALMLFGMGMVIFSHDAERQKGAFSLLTAILGGGLGFLAGRGTKT